MGIVSKLLSQNNNMKFLLVLAVAAYAKAEAEADPGFVYSVGHAPLAYHHVPLVYAAAAGCRNNEGSLVPCAHGVLPALAPLAVAPAAPAAAEDDAVVSVEKREATAEAEAEADPEADPWLAYYAAHPYAYGYGYHYAPHAYSYAPFSYPESTATTDFPTTSDTTARERPRPSQLLRLRLTPRLTPGCPTTVLGTLPTPTATATILVTLATFPTPTDTTELDAETDTELLCPALADNFHVSALECFSQIKL